ncbi:MAG: NAD(P)H-binding protein [Candidatus Acidiferrum sp.]|jgi:uncharacterized protein YbjT (DUF2867 family)
MKIIIFGATGMVGQGVLRECLRDPEIERVLLLGRSAPGVTDEKVREIVLKDLTEYSSIEQRLAGYDACFFCLGVSSAGMKEADYRRVTYDITLAAARALLAASPAITFIYVSGAGTDSSEKSRAMWARVKGATENALLALPFGAAYMFRPGYIQPLHGIKSKTRWYAAMYAVVAPIYPLLKALFPKYMLTTEELGRAMISLAKHSPENEGAPGDHTPPRAGRKRILESADILLWGQPRR